MHESASIEIPADPDSARQYDHPLAADPPRSETPPAHPAEPPPGRHPAASAQPPSPEKERGGCHEVVVFVDRDSAARDRCRAAWPQRAAAALCAEGGRAAGGDLGRRRRACVRQHRWMEPLVVERQPGRSGFRSMRRGAPRTPPIRSGSPGRSATSRPCHRVRRSGQCRGCSDSRARFSRWRKSMG